jgi:voltage-gated potassium channel Kch
MLEFFNSLYFSVVTFTTLGYGDISPVGVARFIAACEAFLGSFTMALFVVVFVKKMTR